MARPTPEFKRDVRKLKERGLTESLAIGYRLSPRGEAVLDLEDRVIARLVVRALRCRVTSGPQPPGPCARSGCTRSKPRAPGVAATWLRCTASGRSRSTGCRPRWQNAGCAMPT